MLGLYGRRPDRRMVRLLQNTAARSVLLLGRNIASPAQLKAFTEELTQRLGRRILFAIDHEGGWVLRFERGMTAFPGNAALGRVGEPKLAYATGRQMALELSALGVGLNLAPVLDVATSRYNPGIGIRSFGSDPRLAGKLGAAFLRGLQDHGVAACAKHFPGKGAATVDAHVELPTIALPRRLFEKDHLPPFARAVKEKVAAVMTSHVRFPAFDSKPATFSKTLTTGLLRRRLGFRGAIISDDLCMGAVTRTRPVAAAAAEAFDAGHDVLMVAHEPVLQQEAVEAFRSLCAGDRRRLAAVAASSARLDELLKYPRLRAAADPARGRALAAAVAKGAVELVQQGRLALPLKAEDGPLLVLFPDFREVRHRFTLEGGPENPARFVRRACARWGRARLLKTPVETLDVSALRRAVAQAPRLLFFCFEARRFPGQAATLDLLKRLAPERTAVCLIRSSFDRSKLDARMTALDARGYRLCQLGAALEAVLEP